MPDTYHYTAGTTDIAVLKRAYLAMNKELATAWELREKDLPLKDPYQVLIMASIIEKETARVKGETIRPEKELDSIKICFYSFKPISNISNGK